MSPKSAILTAFNSSNSMTRKLDGTFCWRW